MLLKHFVDFLNLKEFLLSQLIKNHREKNFKKLLFL